MIGVRLAVASPPRIAGIHDQERGVIQRPQRAVRIIDDEHVPSVLAQDLGDPRRGVREQMPRVGVAARAAGDDGAGRNVGSAVSMRPSWHR